MDTHILVCAHRGDSSWPEPAVQLLSAAAQGSAAWAVPWPCLYEFYAVVTQPRVYNPPTPAGRALAQIRSWLMSPSVVLLAEGADFHAVFERTVGEANGIGSAVHDARVAALCVYHGVEKLWSADRDLSRFKKLRSENPLL